MVGEDCYLTVLWALQSGFGASGALEKHDCAVWPTTDNKAKRDYTDFRDRQIEMLVEITNVDPETVQFGGNFPEVSGAAFGAIQDFLLRRDLCLVKV